MEQIKRANFRHFFPMAVRWGDMDPLGHVNNTVFYRYSEEGRLNYFMEFGVGKPDAQNDSLILADLRCKFIQQLHYPAQVEVATRTSVLGNSSIRIQQGLFHAGTDDVVAGFDAIVVWFDYAKQTSAPVPAGMREAIISYELVAPQNKAG